MIGYLVGKISPRANGSYSADFRPVKNFSTGLLPTSKMELHD